MTYNVFSGTLNPTHSLTHTLNGGYKTCTGSFPKQKTPFLSDGCDKGQGANLKPVKNGNN